MNSYNFFFIVFEDCKINKFLCQRKKLQKFKNCSPISNIENFKIAFSWYKGQNFEVKKVFIEVLDI